jgi:hypothetical protein
MKDCAICGTKHDRRASCRRLALACMVSAAAGPEADGDAEAEGGVARRRQVSPEALEAYWHITPRQPTQPSTLCTAPRHQPQPRTTRDIIGSRPIARDTPSAIDWFVPRALQHLRIHALALHSAPQGHATGFVPYRRFSRFDKERDVLRADHPVFNVISPRFALDRYVL